eukprot:GFUD01007775.1.p1 GENE.GFUD01007775.1~~GFUD01007775.1.p1  ORF type:complete len:617 (+),score=219.18 GFUD01007775.1:50-1900(+)
MSEQQPEKNMAETNLQGTEKEYHDKILDHSEEKSENQDANNESCESKHIDHEPVNENSAQQEETKSECNIRHNDATDDDSGDQPNEDPNNEDNTEESDVEYDPDILAAMEASMLEAESSEDEPDENDDDSIEGKGEKDEQPFLMFCNETELDSNDAKSENEEDCEEENDDEENGKNLEDDENVEEQFPENEDELTLEGEPEIGETPFDMDVEDYEENPLDGENYEGYDPLNEDGIGVDEETNGFLDQINSGYSAELHNFPGKMRGQRGPYKKKRPFNDSDADDFDPLQEKSKSLKKSKLPRGAEVYFKCDLCCFPFDTLGELKVHKYGDHEDQDKPSYLDLAEAAVAKLNKKSGVSKSTILTEIMSDPSVTDHIEKARQFLNKAVRAGVQRGRLRQGQPGKKGSQSYWIVSKAQRREVLAKYNKNKKTVEFKDVDDFSNPKKPVFKPSIKKVTARSYATVSITPEKDTPPNPKNFGRGKRASKPSPRNFGEITLESSSSEDEISIIAEKITPKTKTKLKLMQNQKRLPSSLVKIGNTNNAKRSYGIAGMKMNSAPFKKPEPAAPPKEVDPFEDDEDLTCRICYNAFWYKPQMMEHLKSVHSVQDPDAFLKGKKSSI